MTQDTITPIALEQLRESPFNPRKTFTAIGELADNIKAEGRIHQPLLVRPVWTNTPDTERYEIIFGHRRYRAAEAAGLATVPCMVRAMTDAEARSAQIAENLARSDVHPIEEAEGFQAILDHDNISADALATKLDAMTAGELTALLLDCVLLPYVHIDWHNIDRKPAALLALATHYGIDTKAIMQASAQPPEGADTPPTAAQAKKGATTKSEGKAKASKAKVKAGFAGAASAPETADLFEPAAA